MQAYVARCIQHFNAQPQLQQLLGPQASAALQAATQQLLAADAGAGGGAAVVQPPELELVFRHDCQ